MFDKPAEFDVDRPNVADHLAFGHGLHHCLGRPLAMLESRIALTSLANACPAYDALVRRRGPQVRP